jgi:hypothetical protein
MSKIEGSSATSMPTDREGLTALVIGNRLYAITGSKPLNQGGLPYYGVNKVAESLSAVGEQHPIQGKSIDIDIQPNPCYRHAALHCYIPKKAKTSIKIHSATGRLMRVIFERMAYEGNPYAQWNGCDEKGPKAGDGNISVSLIATGLKSDESLL